MLSLAALLAAPALAGPAPAAAHPPTRQVLMVVTSHGQMGAAGHATGYWLEELATPYYAFRRAGAEVTIASPRGGRPPADPRGLAAADAEGKAFLADRAAQAVLARTTRLAAVSGRYDAVFVVGGHGAMWDLKTSAPLRRLLSTTYATGGVVAAVCHGPAALLGVKGPDGKPLLAGRRATGFTNAEEGAVKLTRVVPYALETAMRAEGCRFDGAPSFTGHVVRDGRLVTGQNPMSSAAAAKAVLEALGE